VRSPSSGFDFGYYANITQASGEFRGDELWCTVSADSDTRLTGGVSIIGKTALPGGDSLPSLLDYDFAISGARFGEVYTQRDIANPGEGASVRCKIGLAAVDVDGNVGPAVGIIVHRIGSPIAPATIDTFTP
jgi:hypothetical protein